MGLGDPIPGNVRKAPLAIVTVEIRACEIAHDHQVQVIVPIQIDKRGAVSAPPTFRLETSIRRLSEIATTIVQQKVRGIAIVSVIIKRPQSLAERWNFVLSEEQVEVA